MTGCTVCDAAMRPIRLDEPAGVLHLACPGCGTDHTQRVHVSATSTSGHGRLGRQRFGQHP